MVRTCDGCRFCCWQFGIGSLGKPAQQACGYECAKGCRIHDGRDYPSECRDFVCPYLAGADVHRPDTFLRTLQEATAPLRGCVPHIPLTMPAEIADNKIRRLRIMPAAFRTDGGWLAAVVPLDQPKAGEIVFTAAHAEQWHA